MEKRCIHKYKGASGMEIIYSAAHIVINNYKILPRIRLRDIVKKVNNRVACRTGYIKGVDYLVIMYNFKSHKICFQGHIALYFNV
jgi:hypothetical protein